MFAKSFMNHLWGDALRIQLKLIMPGIIGVLERGLIYIG